MNDSYIVRKFSGKDVGDVVQTMEQVFVDIDPILLLSACLAMAVLITNPDVNSEQLDKGVTGASEWLALYADSLEPVEKGQIN